MGAGEDTEGEHPIIGGIEMPEETFEVYVMQVGILCPKCRSLLTTDREFKTEEKVRCTNTILKDGKFEQCDFEGKVHYPLGVNFVEVLK